MTSTILVFGKNGQLARCLQDEVNASQSAYRFVFLDRSAFSNISLESIRNTIIQYQPNFLVNCAAYTNVEGAESNNEEAYLLNAMLPAYIGKVCDELSVPVIHVSTDYVFDGTKEGPYTTKDKKNPLSVYGKTKSEGEDFLLEATSLCWILRTSWVYSPYGHNFFKTMFKLLQEKESLNVISDQVGAPTSAHDLAREILKIIQHPKAFPCGVHHTCNRGETSWHGFATQIQQLMRSHNISTHTKINPILTKDYLTLAKRPLNSRLSCDLFLLPDWKESLSAVYEIYVKEQSL